MTVALSSLSNLTISVVFVSILQYNFGNYFFYDIHSILSVQLIKDVGLTPAQIQFLTTVYAIPNLVLPIFCGSFVDLFGLEISQLLGNIVIGTSFVGFAYGVYIKSWSLILFYRIIFALSAELTIICQYVLVNNVIEKKYVSQFFAFISFVENGTIFLSSIISTYLYEKTGSIGDTMFYIALIEQISIFQGFVLIAVRYTCNLNFYSEEKKNESLEQEKTSYSMLNVFKFRPEFFYFQLVNLIICGVLFTFVNVMTGMFQNVFNLTLQESGFITSSLGVQAVIISPIIGYFTKKYNMKAIIMIVGVSTQFFGVICILLLQNLKIAYINSEWIYVLASYIGVFFDNTKTFLLFTACLVGSGFSMVSCVKNELVFSVVDEEYHGLAMGILSLSSSIGIGLFSFLIEIINKNSTKESYFEVQQLYLLGYTIALILAVGNLLKNYSTDCCQIWSRGYFDGLNEYERKVEAKKML